MSRQCMDVNDGPNEFPYANANGRQLPCHACCGLYCWRTLRWIVVVVFVGVSFLRLSASIGAQEPTSNLREENNLLETFSNVLESFPVARDGDPLELPVTIAGKQYSFIVDTGCTGLAFDSSLKSLLGEPVGSRTANMGHGKVNLQYYAPPPCEIGRLRLDSKHAVTCMDLRSKSLDLSGIVGMHFLKRFVVQVDFDEGKISFLKSCADDCGQMVPLTFERGCPQVKLSIGDESPSDFLVDLGKLHGEVSIEAGLFTKLLKDRKLSEKGKNLSVTLGGSAMERVGMLDLFSFAGFENRKVPCMESFRNILGIQYLSRFKVTFDFPNSKMYLKKGKRFSERTAYWLRGLGLTRLGGDLVVLGARKDSPAANAGILPKDVLLSVGMEDVTGQSTYEIGVLLNRLARQQVLVTVRRGTAVLTMHLAAETNSDPLIDISPMPEKVGK